MLDFFRNHMKLIIWFIVLSFAAWGGGTFAVSKDQPGNYAGSVFGKKVSNAEFGSMLKFYDILIRAQIVTPQRVSNAMNQNTSFDETTSEAEGETTESSDSEISAPPPPTSYEEMKSLVWQTIILNREAKELNITVSNEEVSAAVQSLFSSNGTFNPQFYQIWVKNQFRGRPREFEEALRKHILVGKLRSNVLESVAADKQEGRWIEWLMEIMQRAKFKDYTTPPPQPNS